MQIVTHLSHWIHSQSTSFSVPQEVYLKCSLPSVSQDHQQGVWGWGGSTEALLSQLSWQSCCCMLLINGFNSYQRPLETLCCRLFPFSDNTLSKTKRDYLVLSHSKTLLHCPKWFFQYLTTPLQNVSSLDTP